MTLERDGDRERNRWLQGRRYQLDSKNNLGLSVSFGFLRILKFAVGQQRVPEEQIF